MKAVSLVVVIIIMTAIPTLILTHGDLPHLHWRALQIDPSTVDTSMSAQIITFTAQITDDRSVVKYMTIVFASAIDDTKISVTFQPQNIISSMNLMAHTGTR